MCILNREINLKHLAETSDISDCYEISGNSDPIVVCMRSASKPLFRPFLLQYPISHPTQDSF